MAHVMNLDALLVLLVSVQWLDAWSAKAVKEAEALRLFKCSVCRSLNDGWIMTG